MPQAAVLQIRGDVDPLDVQLCGEASGLLVEEQRELPVDEEVVVDGGQAGAQVQLGPFVAQVHGCSQSQVVVPGGVKRVLQRKRNIFSQSSLSTSDRR